MSSETEEEEGFEPDTSPVAQSTIDSLPSVTITDPSLLCSICTNHFGPGPEPESVPQTDNSVSLPCGHVYHSECIVPWLRRRNSCPLCRCPLYRRRLPRDDVAVAHWVADVARALSELSLRAAAQMEQADAQAVRAAAQAVLAAAQAVLAVVQAMLVERSALLAERSSLQAELVDVQLEGAVVQVGLAERAATQVVLAERATMQAERMSTRAAAQVALAAARAMFQEQRARGHFLINNLFEGRDNQRDR